MAHVKGRKAQVYGDSADKQPEHVPSGRGLPSMDILLDYAISAAKAVISSVIEGVFSM